MFSFRPSVFVFIWTPLVFGLIACAQLFASGKWWFICGNMLKGCLFHITMALFACFGYSGKVGIIVGFIESLAALLCLIAVLLKNAWEDPWPTLGY